MYRVQYYPIILNVGSEEVPGTQNEVWNQKYDIPGKKEITIKASNVKVIIR